MTLYHYQPFHAEHLSDLLTRRRIHCATPGKLNDPWDCRPWFDISVFEGDPEELKRQIAWLSSVFVVPEEIQEEFYSSLKSDPHALKEAFAGFSRAAQEGIAERRVYCLTPHPDNILMWSHYADNHRGICLQFSTSVQLFATAREVKYARDYPSIKARIVDEESVLDAILTKSDVWGYENEFRILGVPAAGGSAIELDGDFLGIGHALVGIILGCEADHRAILKFLRGHAPNLPVYRAARENNQYRLKIVESRPMRSPRLAPRSLGNNTLGALGIVKVFGACRNIGLGESNEAGIREVSDCGLVG